MAAKSLETLSSQLKDLMDNQADFPQNFEQWLLVESDKLDSPGRLQFISGLYSSGVLGNNSMESDPMNSILKMIVELAVAIACAKSNNVKGVVKSVDEMDNPALISQLGKLVKDKSACGSQDDLSLGQLTSELEDLMADQPDFLQVFKQWLLNESAELDNPRRLQLISGLYSSGVLGTKSFQSELLNCALKQAMEAAVIVTIGCCAKSDYVKGLVKALDNMDGTGGMISRLRKLVEDKSEFQLQNQLSQDIGDLSVGEPGTSGESNKEGAERNPDNRAAQVGAGQVGPHPDGNNPVEQVLGNPVIWKIIGSYLNVGDLKDCRLVNSSFHGMVMTETDFLDRCLVSLKPYQITRNQFGSTSEPWKNVLLKFGKPAAGEDSSFYVNFLHMELDWLYPLLGSVEALSLRMENGSKGDGLHRFFKRLLNAPKNLRALAMEPIFITNDETEKDLWEKTLENLEEFQLLEPPPGWANGFSLLITSAWNVSNKIFKTMSKLKVLKSYDQILPLSAQRRRNVTFTPEEYEEFQFQCKALSFFHTAIAMAISKTLKQVTFSRAGYLHYAISNEMMRNPLLPDFLKRESQEISFPALESATFYNFSFDSSQATKYLLPLPMLKELELSVSSHAPTTVLNVIEQRSESLRKLRIQIQAFTDTNWEFLQRTKLEEFGMELDCPQGETTLPDEVLSNLPLTIRRLFLRGSLECNPIRALARLKPSLVTELGFVDSGHCFTDDTMKYIIGNFKMLRKLNVTKAKGVTDAGFVGSTTPESGALSGIKGLRTLILRENESITDATLKEIRFPELQYLDLSHNKQLTMEGYEGLLRNNPSLETLIMSCKGVYDRKEEMYASHPRLSSILHRAEDLEMM